LKPGYKASWDKIKKNIIVEEVDKKIIPHGKMGTYFKKHSLKILLKIRKTL
jgi:hypothetical protein